MGGGFSKTLTQHDVLNQAIQSIVENSIKNCKNENTNISTVNISDINCPNIIIDGINSSIDLRINNTCLQDNTSNLDLESNFNTAIQDTIKNSFSGILNFGVSVTDVMQKTATIIENSVDIKSLEQCMMEQTNLSRYNFSNFDCGSSGTFSLKNIESKIVSDAVNSCTQKYSKDLSATAYSTTNQGSTTTTTSQGLSLLDIILMGVLIPLFCILLIVGVWYLAKNGISTISPFTKPPLSTSVPTQEQIISRFGKQHDLTEIQKIPFDSKPNPQFGKIRRKLKL